MKRVRTCTLAIAVVMFGVIFSQPATSQNRQEGQSVHHVSGAGASKEGLGVLKGTPTHKIILWATNDSYTTTTSTTFIDIPGMTKVLKLKPGLLIVTFCSEAYADNNAIYVQALLGNEVMLPGGDIQFESNSGYRSTARCFPWFANLKKGGKRKIKMQYRSSTGDTIYLEARSLTIEYNR